MAPPARAGASRPPRLPGRDRSLLAHRHADALPRCPGAWSSDDEGAKVALQDDEELAVDGVAVHGTYDFGIIPERGGRTAAFSDAVVEVAKRGGRDILRPRHPDNPLRVEFTGVPTYLPNPRWAFVGRYLRLRSPARSPSAPRSRASSTSMKPPVRSSSTTAARPSP